MKKIKFLVAVIGVLSCVLQSCNNGKTYAEMKEEEADAINAWILSHDYQVISEKDFYAQDTITHENEYVLFEESGVYMNIMCKGPEGEAGEDGKILRDGSYEVLSRFVEVAVQSRDDLGFLAGDTLLLNMKLTGSSTIELFPEEYKLTINGTSYSASFTKAHSNSMSRTYGTTSVPSGWLVPFKYIKPGRTQSSDKVARVRLIVPHGQGTSTASQRVYPCFYEITYNLGK